MATNNVVELHGVTRRFGAVAAVDRLSRRSGRARSTGFLGTNGAGKTTTIKLMLGFTHPDEGTVSILGGAPERPATRRRIGYMPETAYYYPYLNIHELLRFYGGICGMDTATIRARSARLIGRVGLADAGRRLLRHYSKGMLQRAKIAQAPLHDPIPDPRRADHGLTHWRIQFATCCSSCVARARRSSSPA